MRVRGEEVFSNREIDRSLPVEARVEVLEALVRSRAAVVGRRANRRADAPPPIRPTSRGTRTRCARTESRDPCIPSTSSPVSWEWTRRARAPIIYNESLERRGGRALFGVMASSSRDHRVRLRLL